MRSVLPLSLMLVATKVSAPAPPFIESLPNDNVVLNL